MKTQGRFRQLVRIAGIVFGCLIIGVVIARQWVHIVMRTSKLKVAVTQKGNEELRAVVDTRKNGLVWNTFVREASVMDIFFPTGKIVFSVIEKTNKPPLYFVHFRDLEGSTNILAGTYYYARSPLAHFTTRVIRDADGKIVCREVLYEGCWHELVVSNRRVGLILSGKWFPVEFDTNGFVKVLESEGQEEGLGMADELEDF